MDDSKSKAGPSWRITPSEGDGLVWLIWEHNGRKLALTLGMKDQARSIMADWLQTTHREASAPRSGGRSRPTSQFFSAEPEFPAWPFESNTTH